MILCGLCVLGAMRDISVRVATSRDADFVLALVPQLAAFGPPPWRTEQQMIETDTRVISRALQGLSPGATSSSRKIPAASRSGSHTCAAKPTTTHVGDVDISPIWSSRRKREGAASARDSSRHPRSGPALRATRCSRSTCFSRTRRRDRCTNEPDSARKSFDTSNNCGNRRIGPEGLYYIRPFLPRRTVRAQSLRLRTPLCTFVAQPECHGIAASLPSLFVTRERVYEHNVSHPVGSAAGERSHEDAPHTRLALFGTAVLGFRGASSGLAPVFWAGCQGTSFA